MSVHFVIDSASDILPQEAKQLGITVLPLTVTFGQHSFRDSVDMTHREFYEKLSSTKDMPTTSQLPPADFGDSFAPLLAAGHDLVVITISSQRSGTYHSAVIAAADDPGRVVAVASRSAAIGERILLMPVLALAGLDRSAV